MSSNTNNLFWVITGAVIIMGIFLLVSFSNNNTLKNIFDNMDNYFHTEVDDNQEDDQEEPEINYDQFIPEGWQLLDIVMTNGVVFVAGNFRSVGSGSYQFDFKIINSNDYEVHIRNSKVSFFDSQTNGALLAVNLPFDRVLAPNEKINSFMVMGVNLVSISHYISFGPWSD
jgi:hypothetical protein